jgi:hypothetical protein
MAETEQVEKSQQAEHNIAGALNSYLSKKLDLKETGKTIKEMEKGAVETPDYVTLKSKVTELKKELKEMEEEKLEELKKENEDYGKLRILRLKTDEEVAHSREKLEGKLEELPPEPVQLILDLPDVEGETSVCINSKKRLYINGKEEL